MKTINFSHTGGFPFKQYTLNKMQISFFELFYSMLNFIGVNETTGKYIITGCIAESGAISSGWMYIDGDLIKFEGGAGNESTKFVKAITAESVAFKSGENKPVYYTSAVQIDSEGTPLNEFNRITQIVPLPEGLVIDPANLEADPPEKTVLQRLTEVEKKLTIFTAGGVVFPWRKPLADIPTGFQEVTDLRGKTVFGMNISINPDTGAFIDPEFSPLTTGGNNPGRSGGEKKHQLTIDEMPEHGHAWLHNIEGDDDGTGGSYSEYTLAPGNLPVNHVNNPIGKTGGNEPFTVLPTYKTVIFIEYVG